MDRASTMTILRNGRLTDEIRQYNSKYLLFLPLVDRRGTDIRPRLAESWDHSPDYRTWTFHLRHDVRWHDGVPVTAHDVAFSLELFAHPDVLFNARIWGVDSVSVPDEHTITLVMSETMLGDPRHSWPVFFPRHLLENLDPAEFYEWDFWTHPIGNGPYRFARYVPRTAMELEANADFYAGKPSIERVIIRSGSRNPVVELRGGAADVAFDLRPADVLALGDDPRFEVYHHGDGAELYVLYWNHRHPMLADAAVRRALDHAIDRRELARILAFPDDVPLVGGLGNDGLLDPEGRREWDRVPTHDPALAARLLDEAGWVDRDADGIREKGGQQARFTLLVPQSEALGGVAQGLLLQEQFEDVEVRVEIRPAESAGLVRDAVEGGDFEAAITWVDQDPHTILHTWLGEPTEAGGRASELRPLGYHDPEAAHLLEALMATPEPRARDTLYLRFNEIFRRDAPVAILLPGVYNHAANRRIRGFRPSWPFVLNYAEELSIERQP